MSTYGSNNDNNSIWSDDDSSSEEEVDYIIRKWEDEDLEYEQQAAAKFKKKRNTGKRPGGTNMTGRPDYWLSTWGQMLRDPELIAPGSPLQKTFMRRFRVPYPLSACYCLYTINAMKQKKNKSHIKYHKKKKKKPVQ